MEMKNSAMQMDRFNQDVIGDKCIRNDAGNGVPRELLYADDHAIAADALNVCISKVCTWKDGMEVFVLT